MTGNLENNLPLRSYMTCDVLSSKSHQAFYAWNHIFNVFTACVSGKDMGREKRRVVSILYIFKGKWRCLSGNWVVLLGYFLHLRGHKLHMINHCKVIRGCGCSRTRIPATPRQPTHYSLKAANNYIQDTAGKKHRHYELDIHSPNDRIHENRIKQQNL